MNYLDLNLIKKQCRIEEDFTEDDELLEMYGDSAEQFLEAHLNCALDDIAAENSGSLPVSLINAMLMYVDYMYDDSGSGDSREMPKAYWVLAAPWKNYTIA